MGDEELILKQMEALSDRALARLLETELGDFTKLVIESRKHRRASVRRLLVSDDTASALGLIAAAKQPRR